MKCLRGERHSIRDVLRAWHFGLKRVFHRRGNCRGEFSTAGKTSAHARLRGLCPKASHLPYQALFQIVGIPFGNMRRGRERLGNGRSRSCAFPLHGRRKPGALLANIRNRTGTGARCVSGVYL